MLKTLHDGNYEEYLEHQKEKLNLYLNHAGKEKALRRLAKNHYKALMKRLRSYNLKGKSVLCLAARLGQEVKAFRHLGAFAVGIDLNPGPDNLFVHHGDFHNLEFSGESVDVVYTNSLDHAFNSDKIAAEVHRVLKKDGLLILEIQEGDNAGVPAEQYETTWWDSVDDMLKVFSKTGFHVNKQMSIETPFKSQHALLTKGIPPRIIKPISEIDTRHELAEMAHGIVLELGVAAGSYSEELLQNPNVKRLYSIDRWGNDGKHNDAEYLRVLHRFEKYGDRSVIVRRSFEQAAVMFNQVFDFIYVDGYAHTGQDGGKTLRDWFDKLKPGGIFAGHDYHPRWQPTIDVVNKFVEENNLPLYITKEYDQGTHVYPSWYTHKSEEVVV